MSEIDVRKTEDINKFKQALNAGTIQEINDGIGLGRVSVKTLIDEKVKQRFAQTTGGLPMEQLEASWDKDRPKLAKQVWKPLHNERISTPISKSHGQPIRSKSNLGQRSKGTSHSLWTKLLVFCFDLSIVTMTLLVAMLSYRFYGSGHEKLLEFASIPFASLKLSPTLIAPLIMLCLSLFFYASYRLSVKLIFGRTLGESILEKLEAQ